MTVVSLCDRTGLHGAMATDPLFQFHFDRLTLWRDGNKAVVSLCINGRWLRLVEADCREMFFEEIRCEALRLVSRSDRDMRRRRRRNHERPVRLEAAE